MKLKKPKFWDYKKASFYSYLLLPISIILNFALKFRFQSTTSNPNIRTICVGNIYIGGTGKTSLAIKIKEILEKQNIKVCFIKKYYPDQTDEQRLLNNNGKLFTSKKRINALDNAVLEGYQVAIFDDGLQDLSIKYDLKVVCFNNLNWIGNGFTIPSGPLRENINNINFYDNIFLNGNNENLTYIKDKLKKINPQVDINQGQYIPLEIDNFDKSQRYLAFSGIGNHRTFINMLKNNNFKIINDLEYPDHYQYSNNDIKKIRHEAKKFNAQIITTEKDYLRMHSLKKNGINFIKSSLQILDEKKLIKTLMILNEKI